MSEPALALSFFDAAHDIHGTARSGMTILFEGRKPNALPQGPQVEAAGSGWRAELPDRLALEFEPVSPVAELGGVRVHVTRVRGQASGRTVDCLGTVSETEVPPQWEELDALRPDLDGTRIMEILGLAPGRAVGEAYRHMLELRMEHGPLDPERAEAELKAWWAARQSS